MCKELSNSNYIEDNDHYEDFLESIKNHFNSMVNKSTPLFTTDITDLFEVFLNNLPSEVRQHYTCRTCKHFINQYGGVVTISDKGETKSVLWNEKDVPAFFAPSVKALKSIVSKAKVNGVFLSDNKVLGNPITGDWHHVSVSLPSEIVYHSNLKTVSQMMSEKLEDFKTLISGLVAYPIEAVEQAVTLLKTESLYRSEKCLGIAEWFRDIHTNRSNTKNSRNRENIVWLAVATAPTGFCHIKSSMIGTLLDDIVDGLSFDDVSRKFAAKMNPLQYQRPQARPSFGNIQQAEKIVEKLGIEKSLHRRFARLEELNLLWKPKEKDTNNSTGNGVFSHLLPKDEHETAPINIPCTTMTWEKFVKTILPSANDIEFYVKSNDNFSAILTAENYDAPPILQWDTEEQRNPFSQYVYHNGSSCSNWNLSSGFCKVTGICFTPSMWYGDFEHQGKAVYFILDNAKDTNYRYGGGSGNALFPETLKSELREIRSTIEEYSRHKTINGYEQSSASGVKLQGGNDWDARIRVKTDNATIDYKLDRWD